MSLIQEALEKAGHIPGKNSEADKKASEGPVSKPVDSILNKAIAATFKLPPRRKANIQKKVDTLYRSKPQWLTLQNKKVASTLIVGTLVASCFVFYQLFSASTSEKITLASGFSTLASEKSLPKTHFVLSGITTVGESRLALINNQVVGVGDTLREKAVVEEILEREATLKYYSRKIKLSL
jgi:hypothetical protein